MCRALLFLVCLLTSGGAWATDVEFDVTGTDASAYSDYLGQTVNVTLKNRTFTSGEWQGVCFPFSADKAVLDATFGEGGYTLEEFSSIDGTTIKFTIMETPSVVAGTPYIIRVNSTKADPVFEGVTFASSLGTVDADNFQNNGKVIIDSDITFYGYYFKKDGYRLVNGKSEPVTAYWIKADGTTLANWRIWDGFPNEYLGAYAYFYSETKNKTVMTLSLEQPSGGGEGGEGGGGETPDPTTLAGKIALRMQLTELPTIYIDLPDRKGESLNNYLFKDRSTNEAPYRHATIKVVATDDKTSPHYLESFEETNKIDLEIKVRGNSTSSPDKRPYRLKFVKKSKSSDGEAHKHDLLGYGYSKRNWALLANHFDRTMLRNALMYHLGKAIGMDFNPGYKFVDLVIDGDYRGTYQVSDHCEVDADRINVDETTGWYVEAARSDMVEEPNVTAASALWTIKNPEEEDGTKLNELKTTVTNWLNTWGTAIDTNNANFMSNVKGWRAFSDEDSFVKFYLGINLTGDYDGFMTVKAYREADGKLFLGPIWDKDLAFGNYTGDDGKTLVQNFENGQLRWKMAGLLEDPLFVKKLKAKMDELDAVNITKILCDKVDELSDMIKSSRELNYQTWSMTLSAWGVEATSNNYQDYIDELKDYLTKHIAFIKKHVDDTYAAVCASQDATYNPENDWTSHGMTMKKILNEKVINRTLKGGKWNTFCLPFSATQEQVEAALGCKYELKVHSGIDADGETMLFTTPTTLNIDGAYPYLIKPVNDVTSMTFTGVVNTEVPNNASTYNGEGVTFDNVHYFYGTLFKASYLNTSTDYGFTNDLYDEEDALSNVASTTISGSRAFIRTTDGSVPKISFAAATPPAARTQLTDLPTVYIDTQDGAAVNPSSGDWVSAGIEVIDANGKLKEFKYEIGKSVAGKNGEMDIMQIRGRGTASWTNTEKKSYRIQFAKDVKDATTKELIASYKHYLLGNEDAEGVVKKRNWVLMANAGDKTLVRNALTKEVGDAVGLPFTPGYCFVDLVLNGTYVGTYQITEYLEADANRVNVDEDNGLLVQMTGSADVDASDHVISGADYTKPYLTIKNPDVKKANREAWNAAFNTDVFDFDAMWAATDGTGLDKETLVEWYIASEILGGYEALSSIYAYKDKDATLLSFGPLWNNEASFDNSASLTMTSTGLMNDKENDNSFNGLIVNAGKESAWKTKLQTLWEQPWFYSAVYTKWSSIYGDGALTTTLMGKVDDLAAIVNSTKSSQALNFTVAASGGAGWSITGQGITGVTKNVTNTTYAAEVARLKEYLTERLPYLEKKFKAKVKVLNLDYDVSLSDAIAKYSVYNGRTANVTLKNRGTIYANEWNGICLPFDLTASKLSTVFGSHTLRQFKSVTTNGESQKVFNFEDASELEAGKGYIIKPTADKNLSEYQFEGVVLKVAMPEGDTKNDYTFVGTLQKTPLAADKNLYIKRNNQLGVTNFALNGGRAYFIVPDAALSKGFTFVFGDEGTVTGIQEISNLTIDNLPVYNLNGQMVGTSWEMLPKGVYIVNGKKVVR